MRIRIIDAFTEQPFAGNPAGVVVLDGPSFPEASWMQAVAAEVNLSETAFLHPLTSGEADYALRWFTPAVEVALCGHATLATAHALHQAGLVRFATRSGILTAETDEKGWITLDFPTAPLSPVQADPQVLDALGVTPLSVHHTGPNTDDLLIELLDEAAVRTLTPDLTALAKVENRGVVVTARADDPDGGYDFVSRFFGAAAGVAEDPVTGSAHTALAPFWSARLGGRTDLTGYQASARGGYVRVALREDRTLLTGKAVTVIDGTLHA
ncbi:PhzF family phenazine biosynthesis protein [Paractinoplanes atraurantiacus]|uniref:Phenazine biosynthesis protein PhzF family n=1 Tax=Paractinoplanes atraurantiacus TaxID=1036182 RepID=A0A285FHH8_9ACTN|nr:PhzF family phenazine biosynthesis protein [Actinoplanes atraurantiacus]SNY10742.1 phenazine biosynthesis protein PhzF family [Actinoplanes atraurantiacus]